MKKTIVGSGTCLDCGAKLSTVYRKWDPYFNHFPTCPKRIKWEKENQKKKEKERLEKIKKNAFSSGWAGRGLSVLDQIETFDENFGKKKVIKKKVIKKRAVKKKKK